MISNAHEAVKAEMRPAPRVVMRSVGREDRSHTESTTDLGESFLVAEPNNDPVWAKAEREIVPSK